jgi:hypothetical protein
MARIAIIERYNVATLVKSLVDAPLVAFSDRNYGKFTITP